MSSFPGTAGPGGVPGTADDAGTPDRDGQAGARHSASRVDSASHVPQPRLVVRPARVAPPHESVPPDHDDLLGALAPVADRMRGHRTVALTGAGMSTDSGVPDYRSPGAPPRTPMSHQEFLSSLEYRRHYWARNHVGWRYMLGVRPNDGHRTLAALEDAGLVSGVITQNIDLLHLRAGSRRVVHVHGRYDRVRCLDCGFTTSRRAHDDALVAANPGWRERMEHLPDIEIAPDADAVLEATADFRIVDCPRCGGILQPDVVFFGSNSSRERTAAATELVEGADLMLVLGSSLAVMGGLRYVRLAARRDVPVAIVNRGTTRGDDLATWRVNAGTTQALAVLAELLDVTP